jgi:hypothetical protein
MTAPIKNIRDSKALKGKKKKTADWSKYLGIIKLKEDPLVLQKRWRNEW